MTRHDQAADQVNRERLGTIVSSISSLFSGGSAIASALAFTAITVGASLISQALTAKPKPAAGGSFEAEESGFTRVTRSSTAPHVWIHGERLVAGTILYEGTTGTDGEYYHQVLELAGHACHGVGEIWFGDELVGTREDLDGSGNVTSGRYSGKARIKIALGSDFQATDADLLADVAEIVATDRFRGITYVYVRLEFDRAVYPTGVPPIRCLVKGRLVVDYADTAIVISTSATALTTTASGGRTLTFSAAAGTIAASSGDFAADGYVAGIGITVAGTSSNDGSVTVATVAATTLTLVPDDNLTDEGPISSTATLESRCTLVTASPHGLVAGGRAFVSGHTGATPAVAGELEVIAAPTTTTLTVDVDVTTAGTGGKLREMKWTDNAALCNADVLTAPIGLEADIALEVDETAIATAAAVCDELVAYPAALATFDFTADASTDWLDQVVAGTDRPAPLHFGDAVQLTTTDTLPAGLSVSTTYYPIPLTATRYELATSLANARAGTVIDITDAGTGTHTLDRQSQTRFTANMINAFNQRPLVLAEKFISAMFGALVYSQGNYVLVAGEYTGAPSVTLTTANMRAGNLEIVPRPGAQNIFNSVAGVFTDRDHFWQPSDFKPVTNATYEALDFGRRITKAINLPGVTEQHRAQRLAKLTNERARQGLIVAFPGNLTLLQLRPTDLVYLDVDRGSDSIFSSKIFEVVDWQFAPGGGIDIVMQETASAVYDWDPDTDAEVADLAPNSNLPDAFSVDPPTALVLATDILAGPDGTESARIEVTWTAPADASVLQRGGFEVQFKKAADANYEPTFQVAGDEATAFIGPAAAGLAYDVRVRAFNGIGVRSSFVGETNFLVGDAAAVGLDYGAVAGIHSAAKAYGSVAGSATQSFDYGGLV